MALGELACDLGAVHVYIGVVEPLNRTPCVSKALPMHLEGLVHCILSMHAGGDMLLTSRGFLRA